MSKLKLTIAFFFLLFATKTFCQDYSLINTGRVFYYSNPSTKVSAARIDSVSVNGTDSTFFNFKSFVYGFNFQCEVTLQPAGLLGGKIIKHINGEYNFFLSDTDSVTIRSAAALNDTWIMYHFDNGDYIEATLINIGYETFIGVNDTVKTITLLAKDALNNAISHAVNSQTIKFSQSNGLIKLFDLQTFPDYIIPLNIYGATNPAIGSQNLTASGIYNYDVGDIFHYEYMSWFTQPTVRECMSKKVLSKTVSATLDTISYVDSVLHIRIHYPGPIVEIVYDSIYNEQFILSVPSSFDRLPGEPYAPVQASANGVLKQAFSPNINKRFKSRNPYEEFIHISDSCWQVTIIDGLPDAYYFYEGIAPGISYWGFWDSNMSLTFTYHKVVYYKKGTDEWGTPINFESILNSTEEITAENLKITFYPNPFHTSTTLHFNQSLAESFILTLYDVFGKKVFEQLNITSDVQIERNHLSSGIYSYTLSNKETFLSGKLIAY